VKKRSLVLRRDVLRSLTEDELGGIAAGTFGTAYSCLDYVSCYLLDCLLDPA
jgi:hypothetical protein